MAKTKAQAGALKGWKEIAQFLGQPSSTAQRWAREGMPVEHSGRVVQAYPDKLNLWLGRETHEPVQIATEMPDLSFELQRGLAYVRRAGKRRNLSVLSNYESANLTRSSTRSRIILIQSG